jgi:fibronectin-binding autotransporter adhesin
VERNHHASATGLLKHPVFALTFCAATVIAFGQAALANSDINAGSTYLASQLGDSVNPDFKGGTLQLDSSTTISKNFKVEDFATNTIDIHGSTVTMSGTFTGTGPLTFADTVGGGIVTLTGNSNASSDSASNYTGAITIDNGAKLALSDTKNSSGTVTAYASIAGASLVNNGTFDISATTTGASILSLSGSGTVVLGSETLSLSAAAGTFSGTISGTGGLYFSGTTQTLTGVNTYTGATSIGTGTLVLSGNGSIATSSTVGVYGTLDVTQITGVTLKSLSGSGIVQLGNQPLTLSNAASDTFSGTIVGNGSLILNGGTETLSGTNALTGGVTVNAGTLYVASATVGYNVVNKSTFGFNGTGTVAMNGVVSGPGSVTQNGTGITTITAPQTYTGPTTITMGTLALSGLGSIVASSGVTANGTFDIQATTGASIASLSGSGSVQLGAQTLTLTAATGTFSGTIAGVGGLVLAGGSETLSGSSTYIGDTTVTSGTLILPSGSSLTSTVVVNSALDISQSSQMNVMTSSTIGSLAGSGTVNLGTHTLILTNAGSTFSGTISGSGGLTISGGTQTLAGNNTYTGTTKVSAGALVLSPTASIAAASAVEVNGVFDISAISASSITFASLSGLGAVNLGAHTMALANASGVFWGAITGSGGLTLSGGTQVLAGTNTYTGGTIISAGTLQIGDRVTNGSILGDVFDAGTLAFARSDTKVFSGTISGPGAVTQIGYGTTILAANNSYSGGTTITAGTLQIGNGGTAGSIQGAVADNGTLAFGRSDTTVFGGVISGTGGITQLSGATVLTAVNGYTGPTAIKSGAELVLGMTGSIAASRGVTVDGTFDVSGVATAPMIGSLAGSGAVLLGSQSLTLTNAAGSFSGVISGLGGVTIAGGAETFSGTNSYTGITTINAGSLAVNGSIVGSQGVVVNSGGTLAGTGSVGAVTVNSGGSLAPGVSGAGALTVNGPLTLSSGSNFVVTVSSASASRLAASGATPLAGTLSITSTDGTYLLGQKVAVLTANGGLTGSLALTQITHTGAQFSSTLSYDAYNVYLEIDLARLSPLLPSGATVNQSHVIAGIDAAIAAGSTPPTPFQNLGNVSSETLANDATQLAGEIGSDVPQVGNSMFAAFVNAIFDQLGDGQAKAPGRADVWLTGFGGTSIVAAAADGTGSHSLKSSTVGLVGGASWTLSPNFLLGGAISAGSADFHLADTIGTGKADTLQAGLYGYVRFSPHFYGAFTAAAALNRFKTNRIVTVNGTDDLTGRLTATTYGGRYETGILLWWASPYVAVQDTLTVLPAYSETAASGADSFALHYAARTINTPIVELGLRQATDIDFTPRWLLTPDGTLHLTDRLAWAHGFSGTSQARTAFAALPSSDFMVSHATADKDTALVSLGAELRLDGGLRFRAQLDTAISPNAQSYTGTAGLGFTW